MDKIEVKASNGDVVGYVFSYEGYKNSRSKTNRPGDTGNKKRKLWGAEEIGCLGTRWGFSSKKDAKDAILFSYKPLDY